MPRRLLLHVALALLALCAASARAQETPLQEPPLEPREQPWREQPEYGGVVTSQAVTSLGHLFAAKFTEDWNQQRLADEATLAVRERSSPRYGTEVLVVYNEDTVLFRSVLPRQYFAVREMAETAARLVAERLDELLLQQLLFDDVDRAKSGL